MVPTLKPATSYRELPTGNTLFYALIKSGNNYIILLIQINLINGHYQSVLKSSICYSINK